MRKFKLNEFKGSEDFNTGPHGTFSVARTLVRANREFKLTLFELVGLHCMRVNTRTKTLISNVWLRDHLDYKKFAWN